MINGNRMHQILISSLIAKGPNTYGHFLKTCFHYVFHLWDIVCRLIRTILYLIHFRIRLTLQNVEKVKGSEYFPNALYLTHMITLSMLIYYTVIVVQHVLC